MRKTWPRIRLAYSSSDSGVCWGVCFRGGGVAERESSTSVLGRLRSRRSVDEGEGLCVPICAKGFSALVIAAGIDAGFVFGLSFCSCEGEAGLESEAMLLDASCGFGVAGPPNLASRRARICIKNQLTYVLSAVILSTALTCSIVSLSGASSPPYCWLGSMVSGLLCARWREERCLQHSNKSSNYNERWLEESWTNLKSANARLHAAVQMIRQWQAR